MTGDELTPALEQLYAEVGGDAEKKVTVYVGKVLAENGKEARVWQGPPEDYDLMQIAKRFGSGDYMVRIYARTERGNPGMRGRALFTIMLDAAEDQRIAAERAGKPSVTQPQVTLENIAEVVAKSITASLGTLLPKQQQVDPFAQMERVGAILKSIMPSQPQGGGLMEAITLARSIIDLSGGGAAKRDSADSPEDHALKRGVDLIEQMLRRSVEQRSFPAPAAVAATEAQPAEDDDMMMLKLQLRQAVKAAKAGVPPEEFAADVYELIPEELLQQMATNGQWFDMVVGLVPEAREVHEWFGKVRNALVAFAIEDKVLPAQAGSATVAGDDTTNAGAAGVAKPA